MRLFVAIELAEDVRRAAEDVTRKLQRKFGESQRARWVPVEDMHLTVRFIGHVHEERVPAVLDALTPPLTLEPFDVALGRCGVFPPHGPPRVCWIGIDTGLPSLTALHNEFNARLLPLGFEPEKRPYSAHLTLARLKDAPRGAAVAVGDAVRTTQVRSARCRIDHATVFESRLSPRGSTYTRLLEVPLI
jgi:RNA 2',3'-cyclic 3'-phosphodiesterase